MKSLIRNEWIVSNIVFSKWNTRLVWEPSANVHYCGVMRRQKFASEFSQEFDLQTAIYNKKIKHENVVLSKF